MRTRLVMIGLLATMAFPAASNAQMTGPTGPGLQSAINHLSYCSDLRTEVQNKLKYRDFLDEFLEECKRVDEIGWRALKSSWPERKSEYARKYGIDNLEHLLVHCLEQKKWRDLINDDIYRKIAELDKNCGSW